MLINQSVSPKQPDEQTRYGGDWRARLSYFPGVTIVTSSWSLVPGSDGALSIGGSAISVDGTQTSALFTGGTAGTVYTVKNSVTLSDGQVWHGYGVLEVASEATLLRL